MRWLWTLILIGLFSTTGLAQGRCVAESQLSEGDYARVLPGEANNVREQPERGAELVGQIPGGSLFEVTSDPVCDDSYVWVEVQYGDVIGWTVEATADEYWVLPYPVEVYSDDVIQFAYPEDYLDEVIVETLPAQDQMGGYYPERQEYTLVYPTETDHPRWWELTLMRTSEITDEAPLADEALTELKSLIVGQPGLSLLADDLLPQDPLFLGAKRMMVVSPHYVAMTGGYGVAFVIFYAQDLIPVTNEDIFYNYLALTDDEAYFVLMRLPISTLILPATYADFKFPSGDWEDNYDTYLSNLTNTLDMLTASEWEPTMDTLDAIASSIYVKGDFGE